MKAFGLGALLALALFALQALGALGVLMLSLLLFHPLFSLLLVLVVLLTARWLMKRGSHRAMKEIDVSGLQCLSPGRHRRRGWH
jgi:hypothetical protein